MSEASQTPLSTRAFDGKGGVRSGEPGTGAFEWVHLNWETPEATAWFDGPGQLTEEVVDALCAPETRPRCAIYHTPAGDGAFINLRGVNLNEGAEPEDMISIRIWLEPKRVVSAWRRELRAVGDIEEASAHGYAPTSPGDFVAKLALRLADRAEPIVATLSETVDDMEEAVLAEAPPDGLRTQLAGVRRRAIVLRRYMFPQRDALSTLAIEDIDWLTDRDRSRIREAADRITRLAEELDAIRERAAVVQDQLVERRAEAMNRNMLILAVVAAIFLPLGLLTGLLGINVGGIPGAETSWAFWGVCGLLICTTFFQLWLYRKLRLI